MKIESQTATTVIIIVHQERVEREIIPQIYQC